ncbi:hypothetical protein V6N13_108323 [Hibiscus sabdariffa]
MSKGCHGLQSLITPLLRNLILLLIKEIHVWCWSRLLTRLMLLVPLMVPAVQPIILEQSPKVVEHTSTNRDVNHVESDPRAPSRPLLSEWVQNLTSNRDMVRPLPAHTDAPPLIPPNTLDTETLRSDVAAVDRQILNSDVVALGWGVMTRQLLQLC